MGEELTVDISKLEPLEVGKHILFFRAQVDECPPHPLDDCDGMGKIVSFCRRHVNFKSPDQVEKNPDMVPLSYFEHGACVWDVQGDLDTRQPDFQWDGVYFAGLWYPDEHTVADADSRGLQGPERRQWMREQAKVACRVYTQWCNGDIWYAGVTVYETRYTDKGEVYDKEEDYRYDENCYEEACGGLYGTEGVKEFLAETGKFALELVGCKDLLAVEG